MGNGGKGTHKDAKSDEDLKVRFLNLWGGSSECRAVTSSSRGSVFRDPARMEAAVTRPIVMPFVVPPCCSSLARCWNCRRRSWCDGGAGEDDAEGGDAGRVLGLAPRYSRDRGGILGGDRRSGGGGDVCAIAEG